MMLCHKNYWHLWIVSYLVKCIFCNLSGVISNRGNREDSEQYVRLNNMSSDSGRNVQFNNVSSNNFVWNDQVIPEASPLLRHDRLAFPSHLHRNRLMFSQSENVGTTKEKLILSRKKQEKKTEKLFPRWLRQIQFNIFRQKRSAGSDRIKDEKTVLSNEQVKKQVVYTRTLKDTGQSVEKAKETTVLTGKSDYISTEISSIRGEKFNNDYESLQWMKFNFNMTNNASPCTVVECSLGLMVNCTYLNLDHIEPNWFPRNATTVLLDYNALTIIPNGIFQNLSKLVILSVTNNKLKKLESGSFIGLGHLKVLNLENNELDMTSGVYPQFVFSPLVSLRELRLLQQISIGQHSYPEGLFKSLTHLELLSINTVGETLHFNSEFRRLTNLTQLEITGNVQFMDNSSFENVIYLTTLRMSFFQSVLKASLGLFKPLKNLDILDFSGLRLGLKETLELLVPFEGRNMSLISLDAVNRFYQQSFTSILSGDGVLDEKKMKHLVKICVREVRLSRNKIYIIEESAFYDRSVWNKCLKSLVISDNPVIGTAMALVSLFQLQSLTSFTLIGLMRNCQSENQMFGSFGQLKGKVSIRQSLYTEGSTSYDDSTKNKSLFAASFHYKDDSKMKSKFQFGSLLSIDQDKRDSDTVGKTEFFHVTNSLKHVTIQSIVESGYMFNNINLVGAERLTYFDISNNNFQGFTGTISGLTGLKTLLLSGNKLSFLSVSFFDTFPNVENLDISSCYLQTSFMFANGNRIFKNLKNLKRLDLSLNLLSLLTKDVFSWNPAIESVYLSGNRFREVPFDLKYTPNLKVLDLRENSLTTLKNNILAEFDYLGTKSNDFSLRLSGNILSCSCENLHFLQWIFSTNVNLDNERNFTCMDSAGVLTYTSAFVDLEGVWRKCQGKFFFSASLVLLCVMCIGFLTVFVVNRNKFYITSKLLKLLGGMKLKSSSDYKIGVFIGYADKDYRFPCSHLRVYIEKNLGLSTYILDRDLNLSCDTASGISYAINCSWRTVLVITERFLVEDPWAMFTLRSALYSQTADNPERVVILVEQSLHHLLPMEVVSSIPEKNIVYVQYWTLDYELKEKLRTRLSADRHYDLYTIKHR